MESGQKSKTALVTGGTRGIGLGIAQALAKDGWNLILNGVRPENQIAQVLNNLRALDCQVAYAQGDIGIAEGRKAIREVALEASGGQAVNLLVNNAGVAPKERLDLLETTEDNYDFVLDINLKGPFFLTQAIARDMVAARESSPEFEASIVNISSISATVASVNRAEYCIAKAGLSMLTLAFASRMGEYGIPVYEIRPGVTKTDMTALPAVTEKYDRLIEDGLCVTKRWGEPDDVGKAVASLARGDFPYSTGQVIMVDGGLTIPRL